MTKENVEWLTGYLVGVHKGKRTGRWQGSVMTAVFVLGWWAAGRWIW
jgi:hypothetical protein